MSDYTGNVGNGGIGRDLGNRHGNVEAFLRLVDQTNADAARQQLLEPRDRVTPFTYRYHQYLNNGTVECPTIGWLVPLDNDPLVVIECDEIMFALGRMAMVVLILLRHIVHNTTRDFDYNRRMRRIRTDFHITVYAMRADGHWLQGDVYIIYHTYSVWEFMEDQERMDYHLGGKGIELWDYERTYLSPKPFLSGGQRLDALMDEGREIWPADQYWTPGQSPPPAPFRPYRNGEEIEAPRIRNYIANQAGRRRPVRANARTRGPRNRPNQQAQNLDQDVEESIHEDFEPEAPTEETVVNAPAAAHASVWVACAEENNQFSTLRFTEALQRPAPGGNMGLAVRGNRGGANNAYGGATNVHQQEGDGGQEPGRRDTQQATRGAADLQTRREEGRGHRRGGMNTRATQPPPTPAPRQVPQIDEDGFQLVTRRHR